MSFISATAPQYLAELDPRAAFPGAFRNNGEINTLQGNRNWTRAREAELESPVSGKRAKDLVPIIQAGGSDSGELGQCRRGGDVVGARCAARDDDARARGMGEYASYAEQSCRNFYEYHAFRLSEPWDGPASLAFTDGVIVGATLDRNGLRPARYLLTSDSLLIMGSEAGMVTVDNKSVVEKGAPGTRGQMICVDTSKGLPASQRPDQGLDGRSAALRKLGEATITPSRRLPGEPATGRSARRLRADAPTNRFWLYQRRDPARAANHGGRGARTDLVDGRRYGAFGAVQHPQVDFGVLQAEVRAGDQSAHRSDPRRDGVMSLDTLIWAGGGAFLRRPEGHARLLTSRASPLMTDEEMQQLRRIGEPAFHAITVPVSVDPAEGPEGMDAGLQAICKTAEQAVDDGATIVILSDRGTSPSKVPIPMLLAVGAVHHHLIRSGRRMKASQIAGETGAARDVHQIATLIGFGASAVNPYLAFATLREMVLFGRPSRTSSSAKALEGYEASIDAGLLKIMSKMGISTVSGYHAAQIFEAIGLDEALVDRCFWGTSSRIGGIGLLDLARETIDRHSIAFGLEAAKLDEGGYYRYRRDGEYHTWNPEVIKAFHRARDVGTYAEYKIYANLVNGRPPVAIRDLLDFSPDRSPIPIEDVEPVESILKEVRDVGHVAWGWPEPRGA